MFNSHIAKCIILYFIETKQVVTGYRGISNPRLFIIIFRQGGINIFRQQSLQHIHWHRLTIYPPVNLLLITYS